MYFPLRLQLPLLSQVISVFSRLIGTYGLNQRHCPADDNHSEDNGYTKRSLSPGAANTYSVMNEIIPNAINTNVNGVMLSIFLQ